VGVIAALPVLKVKDLLSQTSMNQEVARYSDELGPSEIVQTRLGHAAGHGADDCSQVKDPAWMLVRLAVSLSRRMPKAAKGGGWYVWRRMLAYVGLTISEYVEQ
jgi:hypothetical protein